MPKIAQLIESRLHAWFDERVVEPRFQQIALPSLWPRKRNTRGGDEDEEAVEDDDEDEADATLVEPVETVEHTPDATIPTIRTPTAATPTPAPRSSARPLAPAENLQARLEAEGAKLREAEIKAGERRRENGGGNGNGNGECRSGAGESGVALERGTGTGAGAVGITFAGRVARAEPEAGDASAWE